MDPDALEAMHELRAFMFERVYESDTAAGQKHVAIEVIRRLVDHHLAHPDQIPVTYRDTEADAVTPGRRLRLGMTDRFALNMHDRLRRRRDVADDARYFATLRAHRGKWRPRLASEPLRLACADPFGAHSARQSAPPALLIRPWSRGGGGALELAGDLVAVGLGEVDLGGPLLQRAHVLDHLGVLGGHLVDGLPQSSACSGCAERDGQLQHLLDALEQRHGRPGDGGCET